MITIQALSLLLVAISAWEPTADGEGFQTRQSTLFVPAEGMVTTALEMRFDWQRPSQAGWYAQWSTRAELSGEDESLEFYWSDDFFGPTRGYHVFQVLLGDKPIWERDVAGGPLLEKVTLALPAGPPVRKLAFRLYERKAVTNFGVVVKVAGVRLISGARSRPLLPLEKKNIDYRELPPDLPLAATPVRGSWTRNANVVQPWGVTQAEAVHRADTWAPRFAKDFGFHAIILLPPAAHAEVVGCGEDPHSENRITEAEFQKALDAYRQAGMKIILYTSVMHVGHDPAWETGQIEQEHPDWAQRDRDGGVITIYGHAWLCPSTGALDYSLRYTAKLVSEYGADAVMLDNNQFMNSDTGKPTCHCESCQRHFRDYLLKRVGAEEMKPLLGVSPQSIRIPGADDDPLWGLWLAWRKRVWAESLERFRAALRPLNPQIVVFANTQYLYRHWVLGVDDQYAHEDVVLSESRGHDGASMAAKMTLGRALAHGRPLWNYIGTFRENDFTLLRSPQRVRSICAASMGAGANPWIVFYGFTGAENQESVNVLQTYMAFWHRYSDLLAGGRENAGIGVFFSPENRDLIGRPMPSPWTKQLLEKGMAVRGLWDPRGIEEQELDGLRAVVATSYCMRSETARQLSAWVRRGGTLVITPWTSLMDQYGRSRDNPALSKACGKQVNVPGEHVVGNGRVICLTDELTIAERIAQLVPSDVSARQQVGVFRRISETGRQVLAVVGFETELGTVVVRVPGAPDAVDVYIPGKPPAQLAPVADGTVIFATDEALAVLVWDARYGSAYQ